MNIRLYTIIEEFPNYRIYDDGQVMNHKTGRILKPGIEGNGYKYVNLCKNGKKKSCKIHRLVAQYFCENPENKKCVDHIDRNKQNNHFSNLRWVTHSENSRNYTKPKNNTSGIKGISYIKSRNYWRVHWCNNEGKLRFKSFSCNKYDDAKQRAIDFRQQMEQQYGYL